MDSLFYLPNELILNVGTHCEVEELGRLVRTSWRLHNLLNAQLYRRRYCEVLRQAAQSNNPATIERVFQYTKPRVEAITTALVLACEHGHTTIARMLLAHGARPNGNTGAPSSDPLVKAARFRRLDIVEILLERGARPSWVNPAWIGYIISTCTQLPGYKDPEGTGWRRPLQDPRILKLLVQHGLNLSPDLNIVRGALRQLASIATIGLLLDLGLDPNEPADVAQRPLPEVMADTSREDQDDCADFVRKAVEHGVDIHARFPGGETVLHRAVMRGRPAVVRALIEAGADVNSRDNQGRTPLHFPRDYSLDLVDIIRDLLDAGADMAATNIWGTQHVIQHVVDVDNRESMRLLLDRGIGLAPAVDASQLMLAAVHLEDVSAVRRLVRDCPDEDMMFKRDISGNTPLLQATRRGLDEIISSLLPHKYTIDTARDPKGNSALHLALHTGKESTARLVMQCSSQFLNTCNRIFQTPLSIAVQLQPVGIIESLLDKGCDPLTCPDFQRQSLLHHAVRREDPAITKLLLERRAARDGIDYSGETPFGVAIRQGREDLVRLFIEHREPLNRRDGNGITALMAAVLMNSLDRVEQLVEAGAELEVKSDHELRKGATAMMMAIDAPGPDIAQFLFDSGADATMKSTGGRSLLLRAIQRKWPGLALGMLRRHGAKLDIEAVPSKGNQRTALSWAACLGYVGIVRELLKLDANPENCDRDGRSALLWAAYGGKTDILSDVLESLKNNQSADSKVHDILEREDKNGDTPLIIAAAQGHIDAVKWLVTQGANLRHCNNSGQSAVDVAAEKERSTIVSWLMFRGVEAGTATQEIVAVTLKKAVKS